MLSSSVRGLLFFFVSLLQLLLGKAGRSLCFLVAAGFLSVVLTACAGGGGSGSGDGSPRGFEVDLTFAPTENGFRIANQSDFGDFTSLNITATSGNISISEVVSITEFSGDGYNFTGLADRDWKFEIRGISDGDEQEVNIVFVWNENRIDHGNNGIRSGMDTDGDRRADSVDTDDDNDGINDESDLCPAGRTGWTSNDSNDNDGDGCRDRDEDDDDDNDKVLDSMDTGTVDGRECRLHEDCDDDGINDEPDQCPTSVISWMSDSSNDNDGDGCRDSDEDNDDDNDRVLDSMDTGTVGGRECRLHEDCDNDGVRDGDEAAGCALDTDCDSDTFMDGTDIDDDGNGLIEIATADALNAVRYALSGNGRKLSETATLNTTGCGRNVGDACSGYELVADISLAAYANADGGKGWQPLVMIRVLPRDVKEMLLKGSLKAMVGRLVI